MSQILAQRRRCYSVCRESDLARDDLTGQERMAMSCVRRQARWSLGRKSEKKIVRLEQALQLNDTVPFKRKVRAQRQHGGRSSIIARWFRVGQVEETETVPVTVVVKQNVQAQRQHGDRSSIISPRFRHESSRRKRERSSVYQGVLLVVLVQHNSSNSPSATRRH